MNKPILVGVVAGLLTVSGVAQTSKDDEKALRDSLVKKRFLLRGFNANREIRWRRDGNILVQEPSRFHTLGVLVPTSVSVKGDTVKIEGNRHTLLRSADKSFTLSEDTAKVRVVVDLKVADTADLLPQLPGLLFYPDFKSALADLPEEYRDLLPADKGYTGGKDKFRNCDCANPHAPECGHDRVEIGMTGMKPPRVLTQVDPEMPNSLRAGGSDASVQIGLIVNAAGRPDFLWVSRPGEDEVKASALRSVSQYLFKPATCHDQPVAVYLFVDVNFQVHYH